MKIIKRRKTGYNTQIGNVWMGADHPIIVQSMTNTQTAKVAETINQIKLLADAGSELVRITVNDADAMVACKDIIEQLRSDGYTTPIIGDFHYNGHILLSKYPESAKLLSKYRINPGNVGKGDKHDSNFEAMIDVAKTFDKPVRIGVNWGSLDQELFTSMMDANSKLSTPKPFNNVVIEAMVRSALESAELATSYGLKEDKIIISVKMSEVQDMIAVYETLSQKCDNVLHLGLTEAGSGVKGIAASSAALGILLQQGIGDTIRISLTPEPGIPRSREVETCLHLLQSMGFRYFRPSVTSCPGCGRTDSDYFVHLTKDVNDHIGRKIAEWRGVYPGVETLKIAVMGCVVNGPGESKYADIGISLPGLREEPTAPVYIDGSLNCTLKGDNIRNEFIDILEDYIKSKYTETTA